MTTKTPLWQLLPILPFALLGCGNDQPQPVAPTTTSTAPLPTVPPVDTSPPPTASATATTPPGPPEIAWITIYDLDNPLTPPAATPDDEKLLTKAIGAHKKSQMECVGKAGSVATIDGAANGSYTGKGLTETVYLIRLSPCGAKDASGDKFKLVAIGGDKVTRSVDLPEAWIAGTTDVDGDGDNEIVAIGGSNAGGVISVTGRLLEISDPKLQVLFDWHEIAHSVCKGAPDDKAESATIQYRKNASGGMDYQAPKKPGKCK